MMKVIPVIIIISCFAIPQNKCLAQRVKGRVLTEDEAKSVRKDASSMFSSEDYNGALKAYLDLYKSDSMNAEYNFKVGCCYLLTSVNKKAAVKYLDYAVNQKSAKPDWNYLLGIAYMYDEDWDQAIELMTPFVGESASGVAKDFLPADRLIEMCRSAKELSKNPVNCTFTNLGKYINSPYEEYNPFISGDGEMLAFTSRRKGNLGGFIEDLGIFTADVYTSYWKDTVWSKARNAGASLNTEWDEEGVSMSPAGDQLLLYFDNEMAFADIGMASLRGKVWQRPVLLPDEVNEKSEEGAACLSPDGSFIIFSSDRKDGKGGMDLYMVKHEQGDKWGKPENLSMLNTKYEDSYPNLSTDGKTLYFASRGWNSMGGYDLFYSTWNESENHWNAPINIGYPINNADENMTISFTADGRFAYVSDVRPDGLGDRDVYQIEFPDSLHHPFHQVISGKILGRVEVTSITLQNKNTGKVMAYQPGLSNQFVFSVDPGDYVLKVEAYKYPEYTEEIKVEYAYPPSIIQKSIQVKPSK